MVICLERGADLHTGQLMPLPVTVSCSSKIQIGFTVRVPADLGSPGKRAVKWVWVCVHQCEGEVYCSSSVVPPDPSVHIYHCDIRDAVLPCAQKIACKKVKVAHTRLPSVGFRS